MATDWLRYANQSATRRLPLDDRLVQALSFLPELGVSMEVFSGGQPGKGSGLARIGSTRHDHGNAADAFFYKDGRRLDWADPKDRTIFEDIVRRAKSAGVTGFGAGPGYMQPGSMHIGFGTPGVWGAGGNSKNAPDWLQQAFGGVPTSGVSTPTMADAKAGTFDPVGEVMASASRSVSGASGGIPSLAATPVTASNQIPAAVQAAATPSTAIGSKPADLFGMMALANSQQPQFSPVQIAGPSANQSTGLLQLVQALKSRMA